MASKSTKKFFIGHIEKVISRDINFFNGLGVFKAQFPMEH